MRFTKMQGLGNDYIYVNCLEETVPDPVETIYQLSVSPMTVTEVPLSSAPVTSEPVLGCVRIFTPSVAYMVTEDP